MAKAKKEPEPGPVLKLFQNLWGDMRARSWRDINGSLQKTLTLAIEFDHGPFDVRQDPDDGGLYVANFTLWFRRMSIRLKTNYNSKAPYPLSFFDDRHGTGPVFNDDGTWSAEFTEYLNRFMHFHRATTDGSSTPAGD